MSKLQGSRNLKDICDEEILPVVIDNKIDNEDYEDYNQIKCLIGMVSSSLFAIGVYGTEKCSIREILSRCMILGIVYLASDRVSDAVYDYIQNYNKTDWRTKNEL